MFTYPHARSTYTLSKETGLCFLLFFVPKPGVEVVSRRIQFPPSRLWCGFDGRSFQSRISFNVPSQWKGTCSPKVGINVYITRWLCILLFYYCFFCRLCSYFYLCYVFIFFPLFSPPPPWNESMAFSTESDSHRTLLALYWFLWTDIRTLHGGGGCKEEDDT